MRKALLAAVILAAAPLAACGTTGSGPADIIGSIGQNYAHCERTISYNFAAGPMNPASGANVSGTVRCDPRDAPGGLTTGAVIGGAAPAAPAGEAALAPAPSAGGQ